MKEKKVRITMKNVSSVDGDDDIIELITEGTMRQTEKDGITGWEISYEDSEATGFTGSVTTVTVFGEDYASMQRTGNAESHLIIEKGRKHHCHYSTEYGSMMMGIYTKRIINRLDENGGELYLSYSIDINSVLISENEVYMEIKPQ